MKALLDSDAEMRDLLERVLVTVPSEILHVSVCVVDKRRIRFTRLPLGPRDQ